MKDTTPILVGDEFLDGFLWGRGRFGQTKKTTRAWVTISHQPIGIVYNIMERLEKYAAFKVVEQHVSKSGKVTEVLNVYFHQPIVSPGSLRRRFLCSKWKPEFLRGVLYARGVSIGEGNVIHLSHKRWVDDLEGICLRFDIPHKKYENAVAITSEGMKHLFFKEWIKASKEERDDDYYFDDEELETMEFSKDTGSVDSHYEIRNGLTGDASDKIRAISGIADGRFFWFRPELLSLLDDEEPEVRLETRITLVYTGTYLDRDKIKRKHSDDKENIFSDLLASIPQGGISQHTPRNKRIINRIWELDRILAMRREESPLALALTAFDKFCNEEKCTVNIMSSPAAKYYKLFKSYCEIKDNNVCEFIISRLKEMGADPELVLFKDQIRTILNHYDDENLEAEAEI